jgi:hypothetical protein
VTTVPARRKETWRELGPAMKALPNDAWREFVYAYVQNPNPDIGGGKAAALRAAGLGQGSTPAQQAKDAWKLAHDDRVIAAIAEEARKIIRGGAPEAANALLSLVRDRDHKDHARALAMVLDRADPVETRHSMEVVHKVIDPDVEALEELRAARALGATPDKLRELFGGNGLARLERLEAQQAASAKVIDGEAIEIESEPEIVGYRPSGPPSETAPAATPKARALAAAEPDPEMLDDL